MTIDRYEVNDALTILAAGRLADDDLNDLTHTVADAIDRGRIEFDNDRNATIAARTADLRVMLDEGIDHFEGIDKDDALRELLDLLDQRASEIGA
jgi:hypothetical protein